MGSTLGFGSDEAEPEEVFPEDAAEDASDEEAAEELLPGLELELLFVEVSAEEEG